MTLSQVGRYREGDYSVFDKRFRVKAHPKNGRKIFLRNCANEMSGYNFHFFLKNDFWKIVIFSNNIGPLL
jgi:hypothetical protein